jgi:hypothetical protein
MASVVPHSARAVRPRADHAQPAAAGDHRRAGRGLPRTHPRRRARPACAFEPLMSLYLTDNLPPDEIARAKDAGVVALKLYPAGATTNSDAGVTDLRKTYKTLEAMQRRPAAAGARRGDRSRHRPVRPRGRVHRAQLIPLRRDFPELKIVLEHITTKEARALRARRRPLHRPPPSPRTTCSTTATPSSPAASARTTTACRCSSARPTASRWWKPPPAAATVLPRHRQRAAPGAPEGARAGLRRLLHRAVGDGALRRGLRRAPARSTSWKASPASTAPTSTACRATPAASR